MVLDYQTKKLYMVTIVLKYRNRYTLNLLDTVKIVI